MATSLAVSCIMKVPVSRSSCVVLCKVQQQQALVATSWTMYERSIGEQSHGIMFVYEQA